MANGSPLGTVVAGIFVVELERNVLPTLSQYMTSWKPYLDDTILYVKVGCIKHILNAWKYILYSEQECDGMISFLDVVI